LIDPSQFGSFPSPIQQQSYSNSPSLLKSYPNQHIRPSIPQFNVDLNLLQANGNSFNAYPNSDRPLQLARFHSQRELSNYINPLQTRYDPIQRNGLNPARSRGRPNPNDNLKNSLVFQTPYISQNPSLINLGDDMNILKSVMDGSILKEPPTQKDKNQSLFLKPLLDNTFLDNGPKELQNEEKQERQEEEIKTEKLDERESRKKTGKKKKGETVSIEDSKSKKLKKQKSVKILVPEIRGKSNLKGLLWALVYPRLWIKEIYIKVETNREEILNETNEFIPIIADVISTQCINALNSIYNEKSSLVLVSGEEKSMIGGAKDLSKKEIKKRSILIMVN